MAGLYEFKTRWNKINDNIWTLAGKVNNYWIQYIIPFFQNQDVLMEMINPYHNNDITMGYYPESF